MRAAIYFPERTVNREITVLYSPVQKRRHGPRRDSPLHVRSRLVRHTDSNTRLKRLCLRLGCAPIHVPERTEIGA